jgi:hypothetical protein
MKIRLFICILFLVFSAKSFAQNNMPLVGTWKKIEGKIKIGDTTYTFDTKHLMQLKL